MWDLLACRACLVRGVRLESYERYNLHRAYEAVTGIKLDCSSEVPRYLCYECAALLRKCWRFRRRCRRAEAILQNILRLEGTTTDEDLDELDRVMCHVASPLSVVTLEPTVIDIEEDSKCVEDLRDVKEGDFEWPEMPVEDKKEMDLTLSEVDPEVCEKKQSVVIEPVIKKEASSTKKARQRIGATRNKKETALTLLNSEPDAGERDGSFKSEPVVTKEAKLTKRGRPRKIRAKKEQVARKRTHKGVRAAQDKKKKYPLSYYEEFATVTVLTPQQQVQELEKRKSSKNYRTAPFKCTMCYRGFLDQLTYKKHMMLHDPLSGDYECNICRRRFRTRHGVRKHLANFHERLFACKQCDHVAVEPGQARLHELWHSGTSYKCPHCERQFMRFSTYMSHIRIKHPSRFLCQFCGNSFVSEKGVQQHKSLAHSCEIEAGVPDDGPHCSECDVRFASVDAFKQHLVHFHKQTSTDQKRPRRVRQSPSAKTHRSAGGPRARDTAVTKCDLCAVLVTGRVGYLQHYRQVHKERWAAPAAPYVCEVCGLSCKSKTKLIVHIQEHSGERPYECAACGKTFTRLTNLRVHATLHRKTRHECAACGKTFKWQTSLRKHMKLHLYKEDLPHECDICGRKFTMPSEMRNHRLHKHLNVPYPERKHPRKKKEKA